MKGRALTLQEVSAEAQKQAQPVIDDVKAKYGEAQAKAKDLQSQVKPSSSQSAC